MTIGQTIRALRKKAGLTQNQLGALCGITGGAVSSYENGVTTPKRRTAEKLAAALGVSLGRLQGEPFFFIFHDSFVFRNRIFTSYSKTV